MPHILADESSAYYHGYVLAEMSVHQTRAHFKSKYGTIADNPEVGKQLTEVCFMSRESCLTLSSALLCAVPARSMPLRQLTRAAALPSDLATASNPKASRTTKERSILEVLHRCQHVALHVRSAAQLAVFCSVHDCVLTAVQTLRDAAFPGSPVCVRVDLYCNLTG